MRREWLAICQELASTPGDYWSAGKKIMRGRSFSFSDPFGPISLDDVGFTQVKLSLLLKGYLHEESRNSAIDQWNNRRNYKPKAHWSVGFSCYNHILKGHSRGGEPAGLGSVMGPCLQSIIISHTIDGTAEIDVFYRTTELFKKFPADLVLIRDHLLKGFDFDRTPVGSITFRTANLTLSPTYLPTVLTMCQDPIEFMEDVRKGDPAFHRTSLRWLRSILSGEESKFNQARRTQRATKRLMTDYRQKQLMKYLETHRGAKG